MGGEEGEGSDWGERDTEPTLLRRPKRFEDFPGAAPPALGRGRGPSPGTVEGAEDAAAREQRRQQARVEAVMKKLQGQGAQVGCCEVQAGGWSAVHRPAGEARCLALLAVCSRQWPLQLARGWCALQLLMTGIAGDRLLLAMLLRRCFCQERKKTLTGASWRVSHQAVGRAGVAHAAHIHLGCAMTEAPPFAKPSAPKPRLPRRCSHAMFRPLQAASSPDCHPTCPPNLPLLVAGKQTHWHMHGRAASIMCRV